MKRQAYIVPTFVLRPLPGIGGNKSGTGKQRLKIEVFIGELTPKKIQVAKTSGTLISPFSSSLLVTSVKIRPTSFRKYS